MAVTRGATISTLTVDTDATDADISHTVDSGTTLLVVSTFYKADVSISGTPQWSLGGGENLTLVDETTRSGGSGDQCVSTYALVNPTSGAGTVTIGLSKSTPSALTVAVNYLGTVTTSVANAIQFIAEDVNDTATTTSVFSSGGTSGNTLYFSGTMRGGDADPSSNDAGFFEIFDGASGTSPTQDSAGYVADDIGGAPSAITVTWSTNDENAAHYLEIVPAAAAGTTPHNPFGLAFSGPFRGPI